MSESLLSLREVAVEFGGKQVLNVSSCTVRRHETLSLIGHNGSGKSTLIKVLSLLLRPSRGEVYFESEPVDYRPKRVLALRRRTAAVLQQPFLCRMTVRNNVALGLRFRGLSRAETGRRVDRWLERLGVAHLKHRRPDGLSGGEAQRVSLARALVLDPEVLFLDEPLSALDTPSRLELLSDFQDILAETRTTTVFATHDRGEAEALGDRIAVMMDGRVGQIGTPEEVLTRPASEAVARFLGVETLLAGTARSLDDGLVSVDIGHATLRIRGSFQSGERVLVCVRPEEVRLSKQVTGSRGNGANVLAGRVVKVTPADSQFRIVVDCGVRVVSVVPRPAFRELALQLGESVQVSFDARAAHVIKREDSLPF